MILHLMLENYTPLILKPYNPDYIDPSLLSVGSCHFLNNKKILVKIKTAVHIRGHLYCRSTVCQYQTTEIRKILTDFAQNPCKSNISQAIESQNEQLKVIAKTL